MEYQNNVLSEEQKSNSSSTQLNNNTVNDTHSFDTQKILPTKNPASLVSYYCGVFGLVPLLGLPLSIIAIVFGVKAMKQYKQTPTPGAKGHALFGIIAGAISTTFSTLIILFIIFINTMV